MIHINTGKSYDVLDLRSIYLKKPDNTGEYYQEIPHHDLFQKTLSEMTLNNLDFYDYSIALSPDQYDFHGTFLIRQSPTFFLPSDKHSIVIGVQNSNARRRRLEFAVGVYDQESKTSMYIHRIETNGKHTKEFDLDKEFQKAFDTIINTVRLLYNLIKCYTDMELTPLDTDTILMKAGRLPQRQLKMPWFRIGKVDKEFRRPSFSYYRRKTSWSLLHAFSLVAKEDPPTRQIDEILTFVELLPKIPERLLKDKVK